MPEGPGTGREGPSKSASVSPAGSEEIHTQISSPPGGVLLLQYRAPGRGLDRNPHARCPRRCPAENRNNAHARRVRSVRSGARAWGARGRRQYNPGSRRWQEPRLGPSACLYLRPWAAGGPAHSRELGCFSRRDRPTRAGPLRLSSASFAFRDICSVFPQGELARDLSSPFDTLSASPPPSLGQ